MSDPELPPQQPLDAAPPPARPIRRALLEATPPPEAEPVVSAHQGADGLSGREAQDEILVESLAQGMSFPASGTAAGCTSRTVSRRMADPEFAARVSRRRGERVAQVTGALTSMSEDALGVLRSTMSEGTNSEKLRAAQLTLTLMVRLRHDTEIEERLALVEGRLAQEQGAGQR